MQTTTAKSAKRSLTGAKKDAKLMTVSEVSRKYPRFTESSLRNFIWKADTYKFHGVIRRLGHRVLINETKFKAWASKRTTASSTN